MVVGVGVVAFVPCTPGVISIRSGDVVRIGWVCSRSKYDFTASGSVTWCRGAWAWMGAMTSRNHRRAASWWRASSVWRWGSAALVGFRR